MTIHDLPWAVHTAVFGVLSADATLALMVTGVYDEVPSPIAYPYVVVPAELVATPDDEFANQGRQVLVTVDVWSQYAGAKEAEAIVARIGALLDRAALNVSPFVLASCEQEIAQVVRDMDGRTRHGIVRFRVRASVS